ncbi:unnamed protein product [Clavelina lepadiformis]|uniref:Histone deacetylase 8 n=1 Tax=Clavelina lepadiformis TaxID=159417 RepID=A0ABP0F0F5_CLALP
MIAKYKASEECKLLSKMILVLPKKATLDDLKMYHATDYLKVLQHQECDDNEDDDICSEFGFGYDCPFREGLFDYCLQIAGGSLTAADYLCENHNSIVFHWLGGWHHAKRNVCAGYCYINDCVLAILRLRKCFPKILYIDLDLHHGDGVEDAFCATDKVFTFSVHKFELGFFPGTGDIKDVGIGKGFYHTVNLPLKDGVDDENFLKVCKKILMKIKTVFKPDAIVLQAGADGLNGDPMRSFNLTSQGLLRCVELVVSWDLPTLILGGGGYNEANVARCWCQITASVLKKELPEDIPDNKFFLEYGPDFEFNIEKSFKKDLNSSDYLDSITKIISDNLDKL